MTPEQVIGAVRQAALFFGGAAAVVVALIAWLGSLWARRILQTEKARFDATILRVGHEFRLTKATFERQLELLMDYFSNFYRHYRLCQDTANADAVRGPDGSITHTKDRFLTELDDFLATWREQEGKIRLFLPVELLPVHDDAIDAFNEFKRAVDAFRGTYETREAKLEAFRKVHDIKGRMEAGLRQFLRTETFFRG